MRILLNFVCTGKHQADGLSGGGDMDAGKHGGRVDTLVKGYKENRRERLRVAGRVCACDCWRGCGEIPGDCLGQDSAAERFCAGGHADGVFGRLGQAVDQGRVIFEGQGLGAQPAPGARQGRLHLNWHIFCRQVGQRAERHHGLIKSDTDKRRNRNLAYGRVTQNLQQAAFGSKRGGVCLQWRKGFLDCGTGHGRGQAFGRAVKGCLVSRVGSQGWQARQDLVNFGWRQRLTGGLRKRHVRLLRQSLTLAEGNIHAEGFALRAGQPGGCLGLAGRVLNGDRLRSGIGVRGHLGWVPFEDDHEGADTGDYQNSGEHGNAAGAKEFFRSG